MDKSTESTATSSTSATCTGSANTLNGAAADSNGAAASTAGDTPPPLPPPPQSTPEQMTKLGCVPTTSKSANSKPTSVAGPPGAAQCSSVAAAFANRSLATTATALGVTTLQHIKPPHAMALPPINLNINTTTGGNFGVTVDPQISVENLKKIISKKLKLAKDRICLLHREKELQDGTLKDNNLMDGSKIILIPNVETGLLAQRPENTVMQALESLNDSQVNDFLSGKTPLNLSMRLGDHMMLIQLQLSTINPVNGGGNNAGTVSSCSGSSSSSRTRTSQRNNRSAIAAGTASTTGHHNHHHHHHHHHHHAATHLSTTTAQGASTSANSVGSCLRPSATLSSTRLLPSTSTSASTSSTASSCSNSSSGATNAIKSSDLSTFLSKRDYESLQNIVKSFAMAQPARLTAPPSISTATMSSQWQTTTVNASTSNVSSSSSSSCTATNAQAVQRASHVLPVASTATSASSAPTPTSSTNVLRTETASQSDATALLEQSPIKSLSNLVSSPIKTTAIKHIPIAMNSSNGSQATAAPTAAVESSVSCQDPIAAKLTSCLCTRLNGGGSKGVCHQEPVSSEQSIPSRPAMVTSTPNQKAAASAAGALVPSGQSSLHKTANNPISRSKHRHHHHHHHHHYHHYHHQHTNTQQAASSSSSTALVRTKSPSSAAATRCLSLNDSGISNDSNSSLLSTSNAGTSHALLSPNATTSATAGHSAADSDDSGIAVSDTRTLAEASRNLTQTLRKLSKEVFTNKIDLSGTDEAPRKSGTGAVIESMKNHGKGIYSGTFSGTLNPALQDRYGRPKRDISTVIHILNDLLSATPQYSRGARISFEAPSTSSSASTSNSGSTVHSVRSKQFSVKHHQHMHSCVKCIKSQSSSSASNCTYGECGGHYGHKSAATRSSYGCCQEIASTSASSSAHHSSHSNSTSSSGSNEVSSLNERNVCCCRYRSNSETGEREREHMCQKCLVEMENHKTKSKLDQLRLVMQQRKQKREARKLKGAPYGTRVVGAATATATVATASASTSASGMTAASSSGSATSPITAPLTSNNAAANEVPPNHIVEEVDTAA